MLATRTDACKELARNVGYTRPTAQWLLTDYDTWEANPYYAGPDQGHPESGDILCSAFLTFIEAANEARRAAKYTNKPTEMEHYNNLLWVVWY